MDTDLRPLLNELCYLAAKRNKINTQRHRARFRKNYYEHALRVLEAHNKSSVQLRYMERHSAHGRYKGQINDLLRSMTNLRAKHPNPKKWKEMGLHKIRSLILKNEGEYAIAKHKTMELTIKTRSRVQYLATMLSASIRYDNGSIVNISFGPKVLLDSLGREDIQRYADQYVLDKAVEKMVER
jgi:hypothetical protein